MYHDFIMSFRALNGHSFSMACVLAYVLAVSLVFSLAFFTGFHTYLLLTGGSTLELHIYGRHNPYNAGYRINWRTVFGANRATWFIPMIPDDVSDGTQWGETDVQNQRLISNVQDIDPDAEVL